MLIKKYSEKFGWTLINQKENYGHKELINFNCRDTPFVYYINLSYVTVIEKGPVKIQLECFNNNTVLSEKFILSTKNALNKTFVCGWFFLSDASHWIS